MTTAHEIVGTVDRIVDGYIYVTDCLQALRVGWDAVPCKVGDRVRCIYGPTTYGQGWRITAVLPMAAECGEGAAYCRCVSPVGHDGPHRCDPGCGGVWSYDVDGVFAPVEWPAWFGPGRQNNPYTPVKR